MISKDVTVNIPNGLGGRPIALLVQVASRFDSSVYVQCENKKVNAKSIMGMMSLAFPTGSNVTVTMNGSDEEAAMKDIEAYLKNE